MEYYEYFEKLKKSGYIGNFEETIEQTDEEKLDSIDIKVIENYLRKKKLKILNNAK